jgi:hypothetical protein
MAFDNDSLAMVLCLQGEGRKVDWDKEKNSMVGGLSRHKADSSKNWQSTVKYRGKIFQYARNFETVIEREKIENFASILKY